METAVSLEERVNSVLEDESHFRGAYTRPNITSAISCLISMRLFCVRSRIGSGIAISANEVRILIDDVT